jgi:hypothetical protein
MLVKSIENSLVLQQVKTILFKSRKSGFIPRNDGKIS